MPQTNIAFNAIPGQPGMAFDAESSNRDVVSIVAAQNIPFGCYCEFNASGAAIPMADATAVAGGGTVAVTSASASITFSASQTLPAGQPISFASQVGVVYYLASAITAGTAGTLTATYSGPTNAATTAILPFANIAKAIGVCLLDPLGVEQNYQTFTVPNVGTGSTSSGYLKGQSVPFMRKGRIWVLTDGAGVAVQTGPINVNHSSTGAYSQGVFTFTPTSNTVGHEIDVAPGCTVWSPGGAATVPTYTDAFGNTFQPVCVETNI